LDHILFDDTMSVSEEDTYSTIFASLKHPIRRRILRILSNEPEGFSDLLKQFKIESSHLTYHLEGLGNLLYKTEDGRYALSSLGEAAISMMKHVEEPPASPHLPSTSTGRMRGLRPLTLILVCGLIASLVFSGIVQFRYTELDRAYNALNGGYSELNRTYNELKIAYDELNRTHFSNMRRELGFQTISDGFYSGQGSPAYYVVENQSSWVEVWKKLQPYVAFPFNDSRTTEVPPDVNFSESIVVAVFMGGFTSGGYRIEVKEICDVGQYVVVKVEKTYPGGNCIVTLALSQPYHIVKMGKTDKTILFDTIERTIDCS
jgi:DNA-binding transcriptional ArsR family regulator